jgi:hypothetical protein
MGKGVMTNRTCNGPRKNKANLGEVPSVKCQVLSRAGRASSPGSLPTSNFTLHTSDSAEGRSCQTNPIPGYAGGTRPGGMGSGTNRAKQSQFYDCGFRIADWRSSPALRLATGPWPVVQTNPIGRSEPCETKPIFAPASRPAKVWWERTYGESHSLSASAKQSQCRRSLKLEV